MGEESKKETSLVEVVNEQVLTTSRKVAETFGKQHKNVLQAIENLKTDLRSKDVLNFKPMFQEGTLPDSYGREQKIYFMSRDGFCFLVMGFTGEKALDWKLKYVAAFNAMEAKLREQSQQQTIDTKNVESATPHKLSPNGVIDEMAVAMNKLVNKMGISTEHAKLGAVGYIGKAYDVNTTDIENAIQADIAKQNSSLEEALLIPKGLDTDSLDELFNPVPKPAINITGTPRQHLKKMVDTYAERKGITYQDGWIEFVKAYDYAYHTNLSLQRSNYRKKIGKEKATYLDLLEDKSAIDKGLSVAELLLQSVAEDKKKSITH